MTKNGFDRSEIMGEAHALALRHRADFETYRQAIRWGFRQSWHNAREIVAFDRARPVDRNVPASVQALRDEILTIECKDRLTAADFSAVTALHAQIAQAGRQ
jgi:hypothetical protein